jgi:hypothetical protein
MKQPALRLDNCQAVEGIDFRLMSLTNRTWTCFALPSPAVTSLLRVIRQRSKLYARAGIAPQIRMMATLQDLWDTYDTLCK